MRRSLRLARVLDLERRAETAMTNIDPKLLAEILEHPLDDSPRLVLADSLQSKNDPRGEFIVAQCRLAERTTLREERTLLKLEAARLLKQHEKEWLAVAEGISQRVMRRGFLDEITTSSAKLAKSGKAIFSSEPVTKLKVMDVTAPKLTQLARDGAFARVLKLTLVGDLGDEGARVLAKTLSTRTIPLLSLNVGGTGIEGSGMTALVDALNGIRSLALTGNSVGDEGLTAIAKAKTMSSLETLFITANELTDEGLEELAQSASLGSLAKLAVARNEDVTEDGLGALARSKKLKSLRWLEYSDEDGMQHIATRSR
jgi:uncharacterized protein (TIGR02996 family)